MHPTHMMCDPFAKVVVAMEREACLPPGSFTGAYSRCCQPQAICSGHPRTFEPGWRLRGSLFKWVDWQSRCHPNPGGLIGSILEASEPEVTWYCRDGELCH